MGRPYAYGTSYWPIRVRDIPYAYGPIYAYGAEHLYIIIAAKVGIKSCRYATECVPFVHVWM